MAQSGTTTHSSKHIISPGGYAATHAAAGTRRCVCCAPSLACTLQAPRPVCHVTVITRSTAGDSCNRAARGHNTCHARIPGANRHTGSIEALGTRGSFGATSLFCSYYCCCCCCCRLFTAGPRRAIGSQLACKALVYAGQVWCLATIFLKGIHAACCVAVCV